MSFALFLLLLSPRVSFGENSLKTHTWHSPKNFEIVLGLVGV